MRNFHFLIFSVLSLVFISACSTEIDVNADKKEIPIMFGLIDAGDSINYLRVQKAFTNENGDALEIAKNFDSLYYDTTAISVFLQRRDTEANLGADTFVTIDVLVPEYNELKNDGVFTAPGQYVYRTDYTDFQTEERFEYQFKFVNNLSGLEASAKTDIVGCGNISFPTDYDCEDGFTGGLIRNLDINVDGGNNPRTFIRLNVPTNGSFFSLEAVIEFEEEYNSGVKQLFKTTDRPWLVYQGRIDNTGNRLGDPEVIPIGETAFGSYMTQYIDTVNNVRQDSVIRRNLVSISFNFYYYNLSYSNYVEINGNFNPIAQTQPIYTNVQNGLGLVASRSVVESPAVQLSTVQNFDNSSYFIDWPGLKFQY